MKQVIIFGTGSTGERIFHMISKNEEKKVIAFLDNDTVKWGTKLFQIPIIGNAKAVKGMDYDEIIIASLPGLYQIKEELLQEGIASGKVNSSYIEVQVQARIHFLENYASLVLPPNRAFNVAEGGVFQGEFAKEISRCFPEASLYLFDTFEGFDKRDLNKEKEKQYSHMPEKHLHMTTEELVKAKLENPDKAIIRKGYFPETTCGLEKETFLFVNLDFDLYNPTLEGLKFFYPRMEKNGWGG